MALKIKNQKQLNIYLQRYALRIEAALIYMLEYMVADLTNHAKESAGYKDQTSNLKGSIGGVVLKDGRPVTYRGFDGGGEVGHVEGLDYINSITDQYKSGYVVLVVAGMEYATYVEHLSGLNVLAKSNLKMQREMPGMLKKLKAKL